MSRRTLDVLGNMSKREAECFTKTAQFAIVQPSTSFIIRHHELSDRYGIVNDLFLLEDFGVIINSSDSECGGTATKGAVLLRAGNLCCVSNNEKSQYWGVPANRYTQAGHELLKLVDYTPNENYILDCFRAIKQKTQPLKIAIHRINDYHDGEIILGDEIE